MMIELLRPVGPELARRWLATLLLVPEAEREAVVAAVERQMALEYAPEHVDRGLDGAAGGDEPSDPTP
ncbi:MAG: hypothetical protein AAGI17_03915 [Planctomycetota bacterium]